MAKDVEYLNARLTSGIEVWTSDRPPVLLKSFLIKFCVAKPS